MKRKIPPALVLYFLSPAIGELLSGSAPPVEFFNPFGLIILPALYGSGALLVRELTLRWEKRWPTILVLGLAYGIIEEGLMVKSFFDPNWVDLGLLGVYGRWAGVNWVWSISLMIYHAVISIAIPILLVELLYPERRDEPWLGKRGRVGLSVLLAMTVAFGFLALTTYRPPFLTYTLAIILTVILAWIARRLPRKFHWNTPGKPWNAIWLGMMGFAGILGFFICSWALPEWGIHPLGTSLALIGGGYLYLRIAWRASGGGGWDDRERFALAAGVLSFFVLLAPLTENDPSRLDNPAGMTVVALFTFVALVLMGRRIHGRGQAQVTAA
jgi:hypothetical protein